MALGPVAELPPSVVLYSAKTAINTMNTASRSSIAVPNFTPQPIVDVVADVVADVVGVPGDDPDDVVVVITYGLAVVVVAGQIYDLFLTLK